MVSPVTTRLLFAIGAQLGWVNRQADAIAAYLLGRLQAPVYMFLPHGFYNRYAHQVCQVNGSLYGLEPAAKIWHNLLSSKLQRLGFSQSAFHPSLWHNSKRSHLYITTYVDDFHVFASRSKDADWLIESLMQRLELKDLATLEKYLGMEVSFTDSFVHLRQSAHIRKLIEDFHLHDSPPLRIPFDPKTNIDDHPDPTLLKRYQHAVGSLQRLASHTRPDIARVSSFLGQFNARPSPESFDLLLHVIRYLKGTTTLGQSFSKSAGRDITITGYSDSDWAGGALWGERRSQSRYIFYCSSTPIS